MLPPLFNLNSLRDATRLDDMNAGSLVLVPNNRLAQAIQQAWGQYMAASGNESWLTPRIYSLKNWLGECWQELVDRGYPEALQGTLITTEQESFLWQQIIENSDPSLPVNTSASAQQAFRICEEWQIPSEQLQQAESPLFTWQQEFRAALKKHRLITTAECAQILTSAAQDNVITKEPRITAFAFQNLPPVYLQLLELLGETISVHSNQSQNAQQEDYQPSSFRVAAYDNQQEIIAAAQWCKQALDTAEQTGKQTRIGIVVPELVRFRPQVERIFREQLEPGFRTVNTPHTVPTFNISAGIPLAQTPLVQTAFSLLRLNKPNQPLDNYLQLLQSPFWGTAEQLEIRQEAVLRLYDDSIPSPTANRFRYLIHQAEQQKLTEDAGSPISLANRLENFHLLQKGQPAKQPLSNWFDIFNQQLEILGWPGYRSLDSIEYQQLEHWQRLQEKIKQVSPLMGHITLNSALTTITRLANSSVFQPETSDSPVQILGVLESAGLSFDYCWVMSMNAHQWPNPCKPNPLIPAWLQRKTRSPRACPERELDIAEQLIEDFQRNSQQTVFSYSQFDGDRALQPSALIAKLPAWNQTECEKETESRNESIPGLQVVEDSQGEPLALNSDQPVRGGSGLFREQAICPFNSYAKHRLGARNPQPPTPGLSALDRGNILHQCLELFWNTTKSQATLLAMNETQQTAALTQAIEDTLAPWKSRRADLFTEQYYLLERDYLTQLLTRWLDLERQRPPFAVIATEQSTEQTFTGIPLKLRIDRIDEVQGQHIVIDYKTGATKPGASSWRGERPREPQLPLYALLDNNTYGAAFASLNAQQLGFYGLLLDGAASESLFPSLSLPGEKDMLEGAANLRSQWQHCLETLAEEIKSGYAAVQFLSTQDVVKEPELWALNRWPEPVLAPDSALPPASALPQDGNS